MTPLFGPGWGNYAIQGIVEATAPPNVSMVPITPGWWILGGGLIFATTVYAYRRAREYRANRYRREAFHVLNDLRQRVAHGDDSALRELAPLLRAAAIHACSERAIAASLRGTQWNDLLYQLAPNVELPASDIEYLAYVPDEEMDAHRPLDLFDRFEDWLREHELRDV